jgi:hypothetical protein
MHDRIDEALAFYDARRTELETAFQAVPREQLARRVAPDQWSAAQIVKHVSIVERRVIRLLRLKIEAAAKSGLRPEHESAAAIPTVDVGRLLDRSRRVTAGAGSQPPEDSDAAEAWRELGAVRNALRALLMEFDGLALSDVLLPNPVLGPINIYQWIIFLASHEARHARQIDELLAELDAEDHHEL